MMHKHEQIEMEMEMEIEIIVMQNSALCGSEWERARERAKLKCYEATLPWLFIHAI